MSKYELDLTAEQAEILANAWENAVERLAYPTRTKDYIRDSIERLRSQIPVPVPTKIGAVVKTDSTLCAPDLSVFVRWASDEQTPHPWILREELDLRQFSTLEIGRITEVLSEGVDL